MRCHHIYHLYKDIRDDLSTIYMELVEINVVCMCVCFISII